MIKICIWISFIIWTGLFSFSLKDQKLLKTHAFPGKFFLNEDVNVAFQEQSSLLDSNWVEVMGGWLKLWIDQQIVIDHLKLPDKRGKVKFWESTGTYVQKWEYRKLGIELDMESEEKRGHKTVRLITIISPSNITTSKGISIGSQLELVKEKYAGLIDEKFSSSDLVIAGSFFDGIVFYFHEGKVSKIIIGALAE